MRAPSPTPLGNLRRARTISQAVFANLIGVCQQTYSKYESGVLVPPYDQQVRIATILGVPVSAIFRGSTEQETERASA